MAKAKATKEAQESVPTEGVVLVSKAGDKILVTYTSAEQLEALIAEHGAENVEPV